MAHSRSRERDCVRGAGGWWGQCGAQRAELRDERGAVARLPQQRGPELKAASYFATRPKGNGGTYLYYYFACSGARRHTCDRPYVLATPSFHRAAGSAHPGAIWTCSGGASTKTGAPSWRTVPLSGTYCLLLTCLSCLCRSVVVLTGFWWRWRESNPRPSVHHQGFSGCSLLCFSQPRRSRRQAADGLSRC